MKVHLHLGFQFGDTIRAGIMFQTGQQIRLLYETNGE